MSKQKIIDHEVQNLIRDIEFVRNSINQAQQYFDSIMIKDIVIDNDNINYDLCEKSGYIDSVMYDLDEIVQALKMKGRGYDHHRHNDKLIDQIEKNYE